MVCIRNGMVCIGIDNGNDVVVVIQHDVVVVVNILNIGPLPYFDIDE
jgi:hypothetical protein